MVFVRGKLAVACAALLVVGCVAEEPGSSPPVTSAATEWMTMEIRYSPRHSLGRRRLDVLTTNASQSTMTVSEITLVAEHFEQLAAEPKNSTIRSGATVALKADFGPVVDCEREEGMAAFVDIVFAVDDGPATSQRVPVDSEPLDRIRRTDCSEMRVREAVAVVFADRWTVDGDQLKTELLVTHLGGEPARVEAVAGQILFAMEAEEALSVTVTETASTASIPVTMTLARCDVHAVSQAPDGYAFRVWVAVGNLEAFAVTVLPGDRLQDQLEVMVEDCLGL